MNKKSLSEEHKLEWNLTYEGPALVVSSGNFWSNQKRPLQHTLSEVIKKINENLKTGYYQLQVNQRVSLQEAIETDTLENVGKQMPHFVTIDLYMLEPDREFELLPKTGRELLIFQCNSKPFKVG